MLDGLEARTRIVRRKMRECNPENKAPVFAGGLKAYARPQLLGHCFGIFPQKLWKSLWKSRPVKLQVPENFILLAFCTRSRQNSPSPLNRHIAIMRQRPFAGRARAFFPLCLACALAIASASCVKLPRRILAEGQTAPPASQARAAAVPLVNINTASPAELEKLPGIGRGLAARIVAHRSEYGRFRRTEHLMMVRGIGERRYRSMSALLTAE